MLTVACVWQGSVFGVEYVERLHDMVRRNLPDGFRGRFVCLTDRPLELARFPGIEAIPLTQGLQGWWAKMELFRPQTFEHGDRIWYFDLDTVITGPLDKLFEFPGAFGLLEDVYRPGGFQSSVMSWIAGTPLANSIWTEWDGHGRPHYAGGDQEALEHHWATFLPQRIGGKPWPPDMLQAYAPGCLRSYKAECVWSVPKGTSVVFFHGLPRPHDVLTGWVPEVWKVGGGSSAELVLVGTIAQEKCMHNVASAMAAGYTQLAATEAHDKVAMICGGAPSLARQIDLLRPMQASGAIVFSCNQADAFLRENGVWPNFHVMIDARPALATWVNQDGVKLYASMCDPLTLAVAEQQGELIIWHPVTEGIDKVLGKAMLVGGGTTVGTRAMALAYVMGFRKIMCFGMDSSYEGDAHHAYEQTLNDNDRVLDCVVGGERFKAAPWMVQQAEDWKQLAIALTEAGCEITLFSEGMLGAIAKSLNEQTVELDGFVWPSHDIETRSSVLGTVADLEKYIDLCEDKRVALQAGGNVGVWPMELARRFEEVYTFEPDPLNFKCLKHNVRHLDNVRIEECGLGNIEAYAKVERQVGNCGASALVTTIDKSDAVRIRTIDSLELDVCDLLQLDVEGFELFALQGARETINRCSPLIVLELKGLGKRYGYTDYEVETFLRGMRYHRIGVAHRDVIYKRIANV